MYCKSCGQQINDNDKFCPHCGRPTEQMPHYCPNCGEQLEMNQNICPHCGYQVPPVIPQNKSQKSKVLAGILGIILGEFGVHNFYLGYTSKGAIQFTLCLCGIFTCGLTSIIAGVWGLVDAIMILTGSIDRDGDGNLLRD